MKKPALIMVLLLAFGISAGVTNFDNSWGEHQLFNLVNQNRSGVELIFSMQQMVTEEKVIDGTPMKSFGVPAVFIPEPGTPNLTGAVRYVALPEGAEPELKITGVRKEVLQGVEVAPSPSIPKENDDSPLKYEKDMSIYGKDAYYPSSPVKMSKVMDMRGVDVVKVGVIPFQYNPVTKELIVYKDIEFRINFEGGEGHFGEDRLRNRFWEPVLKSHLLNYSSLPEIDFYSEERMDARAGYEYIIIVPDDPPEFHQWADTIKKWRIRQGISTEVFTLTEVGGSSASAIMSFLQNAYDTWNPAPVAFLLLSDYPSSGDVYGITNYTWNSYCVSDNIYADLGSPKDSLPDVYHGRFTAQTGSDLETMINKFLSYERNPYTATNFYDEPLVACGYQTGRWFQLCSETVRHFFINEFGKSPARQYNIYSGTPSPGDPWSTRQGTHAVAQYWYNYGWLPDTLNPYDSSWWDNGSSSGVTNAINSGAFLVQHRDHGATYGWGEPSYDMGDLDNLTNTMYTFVFSINCLTGQYDYSSEVFSEKFHRIDYGALGVNAASEVSYSFVNDTYIWGLYDAMWPKFDPGYPTPDMEGHHNLRPCHAMTSGKIYHEVMWMPDSAGAGSYRIYTHHLFHHHGDCFKTLYTEVPQNLTVSHAPSLVAGKDFFTVTANDSSVIALTVNDSIIGVGEGTGSPVDITIPPQTPGDNMLVTITKANYYRYEQEVPIVAGMEVTIDPDTIDVNTPTDVTVTVMDSSGTNPQDSIEVHIHRYGVSEYDTTNSSGECIINVNSPYGQLLWVDGRKLNESWTSFRDTMWVINAGNLTGADIGGYAASIGLVGELMPDIPGTGWGSADQTGFTLYLDGCGVDASQYTSGDSVEIDVTPTSIGNITGTIGKSGYNIYQEDIPVNIHNGWLDGYVIDASTGDSIANARVKGYPSGSDTTSTDASFDLTTNASGFYELGDSMPCGDYDIYTTAFGYLPGDEVFTIQIGYNEHDITLDPAPSGVVHGTVTEMYSGDPLTSEIKIYRTDNGSLYETVNTDSTAGGTYSVTLPQFNYRFFVSSYQHVPIDTLINLNTDSLEVNFVMDTTAGMVLVINNPYNTKDGTRYPSARKFTAWLQTAGYYVDSVSSTSTNPDNWTYYDFIVWTAGINDEALQSSSQRASIRNYMNNGHKLIIEGGDLADEMSYEDPAFIQDVLHGNDDLGDHSGALVCVDNSHPIKTTPNNLPDTMSINYQTTYYDQDVVDPLGNADLVYGTANYPAYMGINVFDPTPPPESGQMVFYAFNLAALSDSNAAKQLVENTADYLMALEPEGTDTIYGTVNLSDTNDNTGAMVRATETTSGYTNYDITDDAGNFEFTVYDGTYDIKASKLGYFDSLVTNYSITGNEEFNFTLDPCDANILVINNPYNSMDEPGEETPGDKPSGRLDSRYPSCGKLVKWIKACGNYAVDSVSSTSTNSNDWPNYHFIVWTCGDNDEALQDAAQRDAIRNYINNGGSILLEGGDLADEMTYEDPAFITDVLKGNDDQGDLSGNLTVYDASHPIKNSPNVLPDDITLSTSSNYDQDIVDPLSSADLVYGTVNYNSYMGLNSYEPSTPDTGRMVFYSFNLDVVSDTTVARELVENTVEYLLSGMGGVSNQDNPRTYTMKAPSLTVGNNFSIRFSLPEESKVSINIYDCTGRRVKGINETRKAGWHTMNVNMKNRPSGVYFIKADVNGRKFSRKSVLIR